MFLFRHLERELARLRGSTKSLWKLGAVSDLVTTREDTWQLVPVSSPLQYALYQRCILGTLNFCASLLLSAELSIISTRQEQAPLDAYSY